LIGRTGARTFRLVSAPFGTPTWARVGPSITCSEKEMEEATDTQQMPEEEETPMRGSRKTTKEI
jgi:hypothetical protein